jgi:hypothetical protein
LKGNVQKLGWGFSVFQAFGDHTKRQRLYTRHRFIAVGAVAHDAWQSWHFGQPPAIGFALKLDGKGHARTVASGPAV